MKASYILQVLLLTKTQILHIALSNVCLYFCWIQAVDKARAKIYLNFATVQILETFKVGMKQRILIIWQQIFKQMLFQVVLLVNIQTEANDSTFTKYRLMLLTMLLNSRISLR